MKKIIFAVIISFLLIKPSVAEIQKIAVVVNDEIISEYDIIQRIKLISFSRNIKKNKNLRNNVLNSLINEKIKIQESEKLGFSVTKKEIDRGINFIEKQNKMKKGELERILKKREIEIETLIDQIKGEIAWQKIISNIINARIIVTENEIEEALKIQSNSKLLENYEINITQMIINKENKDINNKLKSEKTNINNCDEFEKFGKKINAKSTTNFGFIKINDTPIKIRNEIKKLNEGEISNLLITSNGFQIFMVCKIKKVDINKQKDLIRKKIARVKLLNHSQKYLDRIKSESIIDLRP